MIDPVALDVTIVRWSLRSTPRRRQREVRIRAHSGVREHYHPSYYAAFVADPDGTNIEAVCGKPG